MEVGAIEAEILDVVAVYEDAFTSLTKKVAAIDLKKAESEYKNQEKQYIFMIQTTGAFQSVIQCEIGMELSGQIVLNLNNGHELPEDMKILYLTEYLNIICGRALSSINEILRSASRLTVPKYVKESPSQQGEKYGHESWIHFSTQYGNMEVGLKYNYVTQKEAKQHG